MQALARYGGSYPRHKEGGLSRTITFALLVYSLMLTAVTGKIPAPKLG